MLTKLLPDQISQFWDLIKNAINESLPPTVGGHPDRMNRILTSLIANKIDCWASYKRTEDMNSFEGLLLTQILYDDASNTRNLLIYCMYGYESVDSESWNEGLRTLIKYAIGKGCNQVIAYSNIPNVINLAKRLGADTEYTFISFNVDEIVQKFNALDGE